MHCSIRRYKVTSVSELIAKVNEGFIPIISEAPGFVAYYVVDGGDGHVASISMFESEAEAEESNRLAADWVKATVAPLLGGPPEITTGEVLTEKVAG